MNPYGSPPPLLRCHHTIPSSSKFKQKMDSKESRNKEEKSDVPDLPPELTVEILARVPVKALMRFRCVCKWWLFIISDPKFVKKHHHLSIIDENYSHHRAIITIIDPDFSFIFCSLNSFYDDNYESSHDELELDFPFKDPERRSDRVEVVGSCNGLLCIKIEKEVGLWNPSTRQLGIVPNSGIFRYRVLYGFGYDESVDDYKVAVLYRYSYGLRRPPSKIFVKVFTLRTNYWREIGDFPYDSYPYGSDTSIFVSGSLHWLVTHKNDDSVIVALDLATETYSELPLPDISFECAPRLGVLGGHLCISCGYREILADVWVMKEYGERESWTRFTIPYPVGTSYKKYAQSPKLLCFAKNGELLLHRGSQLLIYNPKDNTFRSTHGFPTSLTVDIYVESLVSPNAHDPVGGNTNN